MANLTAETQESDANMDSEPPCVHLTVPLFIRLLEFAREDAKSDLELHDVAERASRENETLDMDDYEALIGLRATKKTSVDLKNAKPPQQPRVDSIAKDYVS